MQGEVKTSDLYFVRADRGAVKIGRSVNVRARYKALRCSSADELSLIGIAKGAGWQEWAWHYALREDHVRGEWFEWSPELQGAIRIAVEGGDWTTALEEYDAQDAEMPLSALIYQSVSNHPDLGGFVRSRGAASV